MTVTFVTPPGRLADTLEPIVFTATDTVLAVSVEFRYEDGNGLWETVYQDSRFSHAYASSIIAGTQWTVRRSTPWPADLRVLVDEATGAAGGPNPPSGPPPAISTTSSIGTIGTYATANHTHAHGDQPGGTLHAAATSSSAGFMAPADKAKLDGIAAGAGPTTPLTTFAPLAVTKAAAAAGSATEAARADHKHDVSTAPPASIQPGTTSSEGAASTLARSDHVHGVITAAPVALGLALSAGSANSFARSDHVHVHGDQPGGSLHAEATTSAAGFLGAADKTRLQNVIGEIAPATPSYLTANTEVVALPGSRQLIFGTGLDSDYSVDGELTVTATGGGTGSLALEYAWEVTDYDALMLLSPDPVADKHKFALVRNSGYDANGNEILDHSTWQYMGQLEPARRGAPGLRDIGADDSIWRNHTTLDSQSGGGGGGGEVVQLESDRAVEPGDVDAVMWNNGYTLTLDVDTFPESGSLLMLTHVPGAYVEPGADVQILSASVGAWSSAWRYKVVPGGSILIVHLGAGAWHITGSYELEGIA